MAGAEYFKPLIVFLTPKDVRHHYEPEAPLPAHETVIRPLLLNSIAAYVYRLSKDADLYKDNADILLPDKGKYRLDISKECIKGHELLWNKTAWARGSIVIICKPENIDFDSLFKGCYDIGLNNTPNSGNSPAALKLCLKEIEAGNVSFCFSASNGLEWMSIYSTDERRETLYRTALKNIKK
ncbi:hypothetical protein IDJ77_16000 [Mucilaginibacter sp. ZT4R22]|uniref:Uncharacterized protein n=1 Tax=Mucilaginibacter pankratovii TaxID=2772110 RepID=A0ABR7WSS0_9SPHI|nr:hypothetical protein [Mucilaginibacter pankratovii]MBD1365320.1 hypothetical protein [Mucilaginibacter pankratovii]